MDHTKKDVVTGIKRNESQIRKTVEELINAEGPDLWGFFKDGVLKACDKLCGMKIAKRDQGDAYQWNKEVKNAIARKNEAYKELWI